MTFSSGRLLLLAYQDQDIRIEQYQAYSGYNQGKYDHIDRNKNGVLFSVGNNLQVF